MQERTRGSHTDTRDSLTYPLECCCVYLVHSKFDLCIFFDKSRQNSLLASSVNVCDLMLYIASLQPFVYYRLNSALLVYAPY